MSPIYTYITIHIYKYTCYNTSFSPQSRIYIQYTLCIRGYIGVAVLTFLTWSTVRLPFWPTSNISKQRRRGRSYSGRVRFTYILSIVCIIVSRTQLKHMHIQPTRRIHSYFSISLYACRSLTYLYITITPSSGRRDGCRKRVQCRLECNSRDLGGGWSPLDNYDHILEPSASAAHNLFTRIYMNTNVR